MTAAPELIEIRLSPQDRRALRQAAQLCDTTEEEFARTAISGSILNLAFAAREERELSAPSRHRK